MAAHKADTYMTGLLALWSSCFYHVFHAMCAVCAHAPPSGAEISYICMCVCSPGMWTCSDGTTGSTCPRVSRGRARSCRWSLVGYTVSVVPRARSIPINAVVPCLAAEKHGACDRRKGAHNAREHGKLVEESPRRCRIAFPRANRAKRKDSREEARHQ